MFGTKTIKAQQFVATAEAMKLADSAEKRENAAESRLGPVALLAALATNGAKPIAERKLDATANARLKATSERGEFQHLVSTGSLDVDVKLAPETRSAILDLYSEVRRLKAEGASRETIRAAENKFRSAAVASVRKFVKAEAVKIEAPAKI